MAVRILEHPWAATSLGPIETWPQSLKTVVDVVLANGFAMAALWGRDLIQIYNDAYRELAAENHPGALGRPCREVWPQYWAATSPVIEKVWAGETVSHEGVAGTFRDVKLWPLPVQQPLEVWLGGTAAAALERCGRLSDGWLPSLCTPEEAAAGRAVIEDAAARAGRSISGEHFGMSLGYAREPIDPATARTMAARRPRALELTPVGLPAVRELIERFVAVGFSKFVLRPVKPPASWRDELEALAAAVGDLQN